MNYVSLEKKRTNILYNNFILHLPGKKPKGVYIGTKLQKEIVCSAACANMKKVRALRKCTIAL